ncbi:MAG TPA: dTDP-4-dehydrorhamnose 3,5-epimerase [Rhizomicrobium sp.]|nr:dTDP-4-dehydrorhamnose 3,5-epimerase [Rhizomicrobium sp.]
MGSHFGAVKVLAPERHGDARGWFAETYNRDALARLGIDCDFVQDNHSLSRRPGTVRGLHFQLPPFAQAKLVRVVRGRVLDAVVDLRRGSPSFGRHAAMELGAEDGTMLFVPKGFAHGFCTLEPDTEVLYKVDAYYSKAHDRGLLWADPALAIPWPVSAAEAELSDKDRAQPLLSALGLVFE